MPSNCLFGPSHHNIPQLIAPMGLHKKEENLRKGRKKEEEEEEEDDEGKKHDTKRNVFKWAVHGTAHGSETRCELCPQKSDHHPLASDALCQPQSKDDQTQNPVLYR